MKKTLTIIGSFFLLIIIGVVLFFRFGNIGPFIGVQPTHIVENTEDCGFILSEGKLNPSSEIELVNKYLSQVMIDGYNACYCLKIYDFPDSLSTIQSSFWKKVNELDSLQKQALKFSLASKEDFVETSSKDTSSSNTPLKMIKPQRPGIPWIPLIEDVDENFLIGCSYIYQKEGKVHAARIILYDSMNKLLYYKKSQR